MKLAGLISEKRGASVTHSWRRGGACLVAVLVLAAAWTVQSRATALAATAFRFNIIEITSRETGLTTVAPGEFAVYDYSSDIEGPDLGWRQGQMGRTYIYRHHLRFAQRMQRDQ